MESSSDPASSATVVEASDASDRSPIVEPDVGPEIGRYLVIDEIGAGGMGRVFRAYDPKLGREVALKRLRLRANADRHDGARMLREAKAMALLAHPNVVPIYDVDIDQGSLFIAMEYVRGVTLKTWVVTGQHGWREVLAMFVQAGRGLAAAHAQGIVHRDFKPGNVVVGEDGRARVMDFGLARAVGGSADEPLPDALVHAPDLDAFDTGRAGRDLGATLTELGTVVGTPAYMAPEQHLGEAIDARTDQYSFCVALWEALHRRQAFAGRTLGELAAAKQVGPPRAPAGTSVPSALEAIVVRGMASDPQRRWPDMSSLLAALEQVTAPKIRRSWIAGGLAITTAAVVVWARSTTPCTSGDAELAEIWNDGARTRVAEGLQASNASFAASTVERVVAAIDADAQAWQQMHRESCEATRVRHEQSDEALDLRMGCLRAHRHELGAAIELLATPDASVAEHAIEIVAGLPPIARCADVAALRERVPQADARAGVDDVRARLQEARLQIRAGHLEDALAIAEDARAAATATGYAPLDAEVDVELATILSALGRDAEAQPLLQRAFEGALQHRDQRTAAAAAIELAGLLVANGTDEVATQWLTRAALGLAEGDGSDVRLLARALVAHGDTKLNADLEREADVLYVTAIERLEAAFGTDHPDLVDVLMARASALAMLRRFAEAVAVRERALAIAEGAYGPDHPEVAEVLGSIGYEKLMTGHPEEAQVLLDRAYEINAAAFAPDHPAVAASLAARAGPLARQGKYTESIPMMEEALRRMERTLPELHFSRINTMQTLSIYLAMSGDITRAAATMREVVRLRRAVGDQGALAAALANLGKLLVDGGELDEAERVYTEAAKMFADARADDGFYWPGADLQLADLLFRRGKLERAREILEPAVAQIDREATTDDHAPIRFLLGRVLWDLGHLRRAVELVERASADGVDAELGAEMRAWLDGHVIASPEDPLTR